MKLKNLIELLPILISYLFGCITFYVFLCFNGVVLAHSMKFEIFFVRKLIKYATHSDAKILIFNIISNIEHFSINLLVVFLFIYFLSNFRLGLCTAFLTL